MFFRGHLYLNITLKRPRVLTKSVKLWHYETPTCWSLAPTPIPDIRVISGTTEYYLLQSRLLAVYCSFFLVFPFCTLYPSPSPSPTFAILVLDQMMMTTGVAVGALTGELSLKAAVGGGRLLHLLWIAVQGLLNSMPSWDGGRFWHTILLILFCIYDFKSWHEHFMTLSGDHTSQKYVFWVSLRTSCVAMVANWSCLFSLVVWMNTSVFYYVTIKYLPKNGINT